MPFGCDRSSNQCPDNTIYGRTWTCFDRTMSGVWALYSPLRSSLTKQVSKVFSFVYIPIQIQKLIVQVLVPRQPPINRQCPPGISPRHHSYLLVIVEKNNRGSNPIKQLFRTLQLSDVVIDGIPHALSGRTMLFDEFTNPAILLTKIAYTKVLEIRKKSWPDIKPDQSAV